MKVGGYDIVPGANLRGADLCDADLSYANLRDANLRGADLCDADLFVANLRDADLSSASLSSASLSNANLRGADLRGADLRGANLRGADLRGANLLGANLCDTQGFYLLPVQDPRGHSFAHATWFTDGWRVRVGCRDFTIAEAREHWGETYKGRRWIGDMYLHAVDWLEERIKQEETKT